MRIFNSKFRRSEKGQVLVEFTLVLFILMILASGMLYTHRLLNMDFWAQQEARYLAFEQVWHSYWEANDPYGDSEDEIQDNNAFRRPSLYGDLDGTKEVNGDGDVDSLLPAFALNRQPIQKPNNSGRMLQPAPTMLAKRSSNKNSIWHRKTKDLLQDIPLVSTAFATQNFHNYEDGGAPVMNDYEADSYVMRGEPRTPIEKGFISWLDSVDFGERFCTGASKLAKKHGLSGTAKKFKDDECGPTFTNHVGVHLGMVTNFSDVFLQMDRDLEAGNGPGPAFESAMEVEVARGFYSFFDTLVSAAQAGAPGAIAVYLVDTALYQASDAQMARLAFNLDLRYMGSMLAMAAVEGVMATMNATVGTQTFNRNWQTELNSERTFQDLMFADALDPLSLGWGGAFTNGFYLSPEYVPPMMPTMVPVMGGFFDGIMHNILTLEDDLKEDLIEDSNKLAQVTIEDGDGVFSAARSRFRTSDKTLTSRFYLVTQPWHITRRKTPHGGFRELGHEDDDRGDDSSDASSEAMLKKRAFGLFLFPAEPGTLLGQLGEDIPVVGDVLGAFGPVDDVFSFLKDFALGGAFGPLMDALEWFDGITGADFSFPRLPATRPAAYPESAEMDGNGDREAGEERNFQDYIDEQRDFNPPPNPEYHDD